MMQALVRAVVCALLLCAALGQPALAQAPRQDPAVERPADQQPAGAQIVLTQDASETREAFEGLLRRLPPSVGRVFRLDASLMRNPNYLSTYPALAAFLQKHPEIINNPGYYLENVTQQLWYPPEPRTPQSETINLWRNTIENVTIFMVFLSITGGVLWIVKSVLDWRRWSRTARVQAEVHNKLLDRFTANEDLLTYIQTPAGQKFLESAPLPVEHPTRPVGAPFTRILWSVQAGVVLATGGVGLLYVSGRVIEEVAQVLFAVGVLVLAVGVGFIVSAAAAFLLSQRLGLLPGAAGREHSDPTGA
jgi:hypothetical protein